MIARFLQKLTGHHLLVHGAVMGRSFYELLLVIPLTLGFGLLAGLIGIVDLKIQLAVCVGLVGLLVIVLVPARRTLCLFLYVIIQPLSIEKILYTGMPLWAEFRGQEIVLTAADLILLLLGLILLVEKWTTGKPQLVWGKLGKLFGLLFIWGVLSYLMHMYILQDSYVNNAPIAILSLARNLLFVVIVSSAIKNRGDLMWVLVATVAILLLESILVWMSYATGEVYNFSRLLGVYTGLQSYSGGDGTLIRASGTLGVANQQALFHAMFSFLLIGWFAVKNAALRNIALLVMLASFVAVIFTFSRGAWLSMGIGGMLILLMFIMRREISSRAWLMGGVITMAFVVVLAIVAQPVMDRLTTGDDGATNSRIRMMSLATDLFLQHPVLGVGPGEYVEAGLELYPPGYKETEWVALGDKPIVPPVGRIELARVEVPGEKDLVVPLQVHNKYLLVMSELGLVGILLWLAIFYVFFTDARRCSLSRDPLYRYLGVAGMALSLVAGVYMGLDLFVDEKTLQVLLFPLLVVSAAYRLARQHAYNIAT